MEKTGQVYRSMLRSYLIILLVPVMVTVLAYSYIYYRVKDQAQLYLRNLMSTVRNISDREMAYYRNFLTQLKPDETVRKLATGSFDESPAEYWGTYLIKEKLQQVYGTMRDSGSYCEDIFIYLTEADKVIGQSSGADLNTYSLLYFEEEKTRLLRQTLQDGSMEKVICHQDKDGKTYVLLLERMQNKYGMKGNAVAGLWLDVELLDSRIQSAAWEGGIDWALLDSENNYLRMPDKFAVESMSPSDFAESGKEEVIRTLHLQGEKYFMDSMSSKEYDWKYVLFIPEKYISASTNRLLILYFVTVVVTLFWGFRSARRYSQSHYVPIKNILGILKENGETADARKMGDEYQYLESEVTSMLSKLEKHKEYQRDLLKSDRVMKKYVLREMLTTASVEKKELAICEEVWQKFDRGRNLVLILHPEDLDESERNRRSSTELEIFAVMNVYEEGIGEKCPLEGLEMAGKIIIIADVTAWLCRGSEETVSEELQAVHERLKEFIENHFKITVRILEGGMHPGITGIRQSYLEASEAELFLQYQADSYIRYEDIRELKARKYDYSFEMEERLFNAIRANDEKLACSYVRSIVEKNMGKTARTSPDMLNCMLYDIFATLVKASEDSGIRHVKMQLLEKITADSAPEEVLSFFTEMIHEICAETEKKGTYGEVLCRKVFEFICKNYTDPGLNAAQTALYFDITPAYLSCIYKKYRGESIADVIKRMRIHYAETLLKEGMSVADVSTRVGYYESSTFIRAFKSCKGVTPGKIRSLAENQTIDDC